MLLHKTDKAVTLRFVRCRVPYYPAVWDLSKGGKCVPQRLCVNLGTEISNEDVVVQACVLFGCSSRRSGPVHLRPQIMWMKWYKILVSNLHLLAHAKTFVHGSDGCTGGLMMSKLHEAVRIVAWAVRRNSHTLCIISWLWTWLPDNFATLHWTNLAE